MLWAFYLSFWQGVRCVRVLPSFLGEIANPCIHATVLVTLFNPRDLLHRPGILANELMWDFCARSLDSTILMLVLASPSSCPLSQTRLIHAVRVHYSIHPLYLRSSLVRRGAWLWGVLPFDTDPESFCTAAAILNTMLTRIDYSYSLLGPDHGSGAHV